MKQNEGEIDKKALLKVLDDKVIFKVLNKIAKNKTGITLLTSPPGSGKSYETAFFLAMQIVSGTRNTYYLTPRVKNVNEVYNAVIKILKNFGYENLVEDVVKIESYKDSIMKNFEKLKGTFVEDWTEYRALYDEIKNLKKIKDRKTRELFIENTFRGKENSEYKFRKRLRKKFDEEYKNLANKNQTRYEYMKFSKWSFIEEIYPTAKIKGKKVFILTSKKFFLNNDPVIDKPCFLATSSKTDNSLVLIDEIDAIKLELLDLIMENILDYDIVDVFGIIYKVFSNVKEISDDIMDIKENRVEIKNIQDKAREIKEKYFPNKWDIRLSELIEENSIKRKDNITKKIMNYQGVGAFYGKNKLYRYRPYIESKDSLIKAYNQLIYKYEDKGAFEVDKFLKELMFFEKFVFNKIKFIAEKYKDKLDLYNKYEEQRKKYGVKIQENSLNDWESLTTVLNKMNFDKGNARKFANYIMIALNYNRYMRDKKLALYCPNRYSLYSKGLSYATATEFAEFRENITLNSYQIPYGPELILFFLAYKANVIGISATAEVPSINNFNYDFIKEGLSSNGQNEFYKLSKETKSLLEADYMKKIEGYKNIEIEVEKIEINKSLDVIENLTELAFGKGASKDLGKKRNVNNNIELNISDGNDYFYIQNKLKNKINIANEMRDNNIIYDYNRLVKVWLYIDKVVEAYCNDKKICNGIIMTQKLVKDVLDKRSREDIYTIENVKLGAIYICARWFNVSYLEAIKKVECMFVVVKASDINEESNSNKKWSLFKDRFIKKELLFMITTYASVSRGNNLQVNIGKKRIKELIKIGEILEINSWGIKGEKDWESIYLEKPTYVIPNVNRNGKNEDFNIEHKEKLKIFWIIEEIFSRDELTRQERFSILKSVIESFEEPEVKNYMYSSLYSKDCVMSSISIILYQTIGRISRTNVKKPTIGIFYDIEILGALEYDIDKLSIYKVTPEYKAFLEAIKKEVNKQKYSLIKYGNEILEKHNKISGEIIDIILFKGNDKAKRWPVELRFLWEELRIIPLKYPIISKKVIGQLEKKLANNKFVNNLGISLKEGFLPKKYINNNKYNYIKTFNDDLYDSENKTIILNDTNFNYFFSKKEIYEVSENDARLKSLLQIPAIAKYWEDNGFAKEWKLDNDSYGIITPEVYTRIYKGALGEAVVYATLDAIGITCEKITDSKNYEKADFVFRYNGKIIYIDAKNYNQVSKFKEFANDLLINKTVKKLEELNGDLIFVINIIDDNGNMQYQRFGNVVIIPGLYRIDENNNCEVIKYPDGETILEKIKSIIEEEGK